MTIARQSKRGEGDLCGRNALVTGGSSGIGEATVAALLTRGANVALTYHHGREAAMRAAEEWGDRVSCHFLDLRRTDAIDGCFEEFAARWGRLDILVHNAAAGSATIADYEAEAGRADDALFEINAIGAFKVCLRGIARMRLRSESYAAKLITVASPGVVHKFPSLRLADSTSKAALVHLTKELAAQLVHTDIDVFAVCPGPTNTPMFQRSTLAAMNEDERRAFIADLPKRRLLEPREIADIIVFLASERARALHGAVLDASMGITTYSGSPARPNR